MDDYREISGLRDEVGELRAAVEALQGLLGQFGDDAGGGALDLTPQPGDGAVGVPLGKVELLASLSSSSGESETSWFGYFREAWVHLGSSSESSASSSSLLFVIPNSSISSLESAVSSLASALASLSSRIPTFENIRVVTGFNFESSSGSGGYTGNLTATARTVRVARGSSSSTELSVLTFAPEEV